MLGKDELETLLVTLKKHRVHVFRSPEVTVQFEYIVNAEQDLFTERQDEKSQGETDKDEYERTLFASAGS